MGKIKISGSFTSLKLTLLKYRSIFVVYDDNVREYAEKVTSGDHSLPIVADEAHKTMDTAMAICRWLASKNAGRDALLIALGGGVTLDVAGFAASIYKRGIRYANIPTTLLAMVDAGIGGKTGVNLDDYKNMIGSFRQPEFTYICTKTLTTLPKREFLSGSAELLKTFIIKDSKENYEKALRTLSGPLDIDALSPLIEAAAKIKEKIVAGDPEDRDKRMVLNLGHTYGHAIEWWQHSNNVENPYTHGEAVAIGIIQAARKSEELNIAKPGLADKLKADFNYCGLPVEMPCTEEELESAVSQDKKAEGGKLNFVFIKEIGHVTVKKI